MNPIKQNWLEALEAYVEARVTEGIVSQQLGEDGYHQSVRRERKVREAAWKRLTDLPFPHD